MSLDSHNHLNELRSKLGLSQPSEDPVGSWAACSKVGNELMLAWITESWAVPLSSEGQEELFRQLAKSDSGPDSALLRIGRVLDTTGAWQCELLEPTKLLVKAVSLRRKLTQKRWVHGLQRICDAAEPVDSVTRGVALKGLLQTDLVENFEAILRRAPFIHEYGIHIHDLDELEVTPTVRAHLLAQCPDLADEASRTLRSAE